MKLLLSFEVISIEYKATSSLCLIVAFANEYIIIYTSFLKLMNSMGEAR
jgi:hypothetical protein